LDRGGAGGAGGIAGIIGDGAHSAASNENPGRRAGVFVCSITRLSAQLDDRASSGPACADMADSFFLTVMTMQPKRRLMG
jgi:hypothetical protein